MQSVPSEAVGLQHLSGVLLGDLLRRQGDGLLHLLALQELDRLARAFCARRCLGEGRRQLALVRHLHAFVRQAVDADELDVLLASAHSPSAAATRSWKYCTPRSCRPESGPEL